MTGTAHARPSAARSAEFEQYREPTCPGDEAAAHGLEASGRARHRLVIKEFVEETNAQLPPAASTRVGVDGLRLPATGAKFDYARWCAAALAHLVLSAARHRRPGAVFDEQERAHASVAPSNGDVQEARRSSRHAREGARPDRADLASASVPRSGSTAALCGNKRHRSWRSCRTSSTTTRQRSSRACKRELRARRPRADPRCRCVDPLRARASTSIGN